VHLVGFIVRVYHDARSTELQILVRSPASGGFRTKTYTLPAVLLCILGLWRILPIPTKCRQHVNNIQCKIRFKYLTFSDLKFW
jgi:hypothetical protein